MAKNSKSKQTAHYEQIGKMVQNIYESGYLDRNATYKMSFLKGVFAGVGGVVGATVVVALLLWLLSALHYVPFLNQITDNVQCSIAQADRQLEPAGQRCDKW